MDPHPRTVLISGVTGRQGGAVAAHLAGRGFRLRGLTRNPDDPVAREAERRGVEILPGAFGDLGAMRRALEGVWGVYLIAKGDPTEWNAMLHMARELGVRHVVCGSIAAAEQATHIPHYEDVFARESFARSLGFESLVVIRPSFYMENMTSPWQFDGAQVVLPLSPSTPLQMVAVDDIGRVAARAFERPEAFAGQTVDLAGDTVTLDEVAVHLAAALGREVRYIQQPLPPEFKASDELSLMFDWLDRAGPRVDIPALEARLGFSLTRFPVWARTSAEEARRTAR